MSSSQKLAPDGNIIKSPSKVHSSSPPRYIPYDLFTFPVVLIWSSMLLLIFFRFWFCCTFVDCLFRCCIINDVRFWRLQPFRHISGDYDQFLIILLVPHCLLVCFLLKSLLGFYFASLCLLSMIQFLFFYLFYYFWS